MESVYDVGIINLLKHEGMTFVIFNNLIPRKEVDIIGCYQDKKGIVKRVRRESVWGKMMMKLYEPEKPLEISEQQKRLAELIAGIGKLKND